MFKSRDSPLRFGWLIALPLFELALVLVRLDHIASFIVNANLARHNFRSASVKQIVRSTLPLGSKT
jgi:hypothetical protein